MTTTPNTDPSAPPPQDIQPKQSTWLFWLPPVVLLVLLVLAILWVLLPGTRIYPAPSLVYEVPDDTAAALERDIIAALQERADDLQGALDSAICTPEGDLILEDGRTPEGLLPVPAGTAPGGADGGEQREGRSDSVLPPAPDRVQVERPTEPVGTDAGQPVTDTASLLNTLEEQTVLVLASGQNSLSTGTGFFIAPDLVVTNDHVVEGALSVSVTNETLNGTLDASVVATMGPLETTGGDFALLRVTGANQPFFPLRVSSDSIRLENVIAAGFPGAIIETDGNFDALLAGDRSAVPQMAVTDGIVNVEQDFVTGTKVLIHTARISQGNSGGPLVDYCGQVLGVNTFGRTSDGRHLNFSISTSELVAFLEQSGTAAMVTEGACQPRVSEPEAPEVVDPAPDGEDEPAPDAGDGSLQE